MNIYIYGCSPAPPPPHCYPVMYSYPSISLCFCGIPSPTAVVLCIPSPHRAGQGGRRTRPPPLWSGTGWFPLCECMAILSPNPPPVEKDGLPFCSETHIYTHTHTTCLCMSVYVWRSLSAHALLLSLRSILSPRSPNHGICHVLLYFNK